MTTLTSMRAAVCGAAFAVALAVAGCDVDPAEQFAPSGTGTLSGIVFYDANNDGVFNPVSGDSVLAGVGIEFRNRGTDSALAHVTTGADGRFTLTAPVGTGDVFVENNAALTTAGFVYCGGRATTYIDENAFVNVPIKLGCVIKIIDAKLKATGSRITIAGIVTAQPGRFRTQGDNLYIQDASSGMQIFGGVGGLGIVEGDSIEVTGDYSPFNGEPEMVSPRVAANIKKGVGVPAAKEIAVSSLATIANGNGADVGRLIVVRKVRIGAFTSGNATITTATTPAASSIVRLDGAVGVALSATYATPTQKCYDITGVLGFFQSSVQLKPRFAQDIVEVPCS